MDFAKPYWPVTRCDLEFATASWFLTSISPHLHHFSAIVTIVINTKFIFVDVVILFPILFPRKQHRRSLSETEAVDEWSKMQLSWELYSIKGYKWTLELCKIAHSKLLYNIVISADDAISIR